MARVLSWFRYMGARYEHSLTTTAEFILEFLHTDSKIPMGTGLKRLPHVLWNSMVHERLTYFHLDKGGKAMEPIIGTTGATLLVRKISSHSSFHIGDVVVYKDPKNYKNLLVRRIHGFEGWNVTWGGPSVYVKMNQCWVSADNHQLWPQEAWDSRTHGPVYLVNVVGRAIYSMRSPVDHGPITNSHSSTPGDSAVIEKELDIDEMKKFYENHHKA